MSASAGSAGIHTVAPARAADVVSSNIVGYEKINLAAGSTLVGVQFSEVGGEALSLAKVGTLPASDAGITEDGDFVTTLKCWTGNGYVTYGWSGTAGTDLLDNPELDNQWLDADLAPADEDADTSTGFWVKAPKASTLTISGEVSTDASIAVSLSAGANIVANPYPVATKISDFGKLDASFAGITEDGDFVTTLKYWTGNGYVTYGWSGTAGTDLLDNPALDNKWLDADLATVDEEIPCGTAVWIKAEKAGTLTFTSPL